MFISINTPKKSAEKNSAMKVTAHIASKTRQRYLCLAITLLAWMMVLVLPGGNAQATLLCTDCHTMPPTDSAGTRDAATGAFRGNHERHAGATINSCTACHGAAAVSYLPGHSTEILAAGGKPVVKIAWKINNYSTVSGRARYSRGTFFNQTSVPPAPMGTCSNVNCHFTATTPSWGTANFVSPADCNKCHGAAPADGSHPKHATYYGAGAASCEKCHPDHRTEPKPFAHATSAGLRNLSMSFAAAPNNGNGAYSGPLNDYMPGQTNVFGSCSASYCHSPGTSTTSIPAPNQTATWGGSLTCKGCHKSDNASGDIMATGSHGRHVNATKHYTLSCSKCHAGTATSAMTIADTALHVNAKVNIKFSSSSTAVGGTYAGQATPYAKNPGTAVGQCNNVYCHSNAQNEGGTGITYTQPVWGTPAGGACGTCHGTTHSGGAQIVSGSHTKHLTLSTFYSAGGSAKCIMCHNVGNEAFDGSCNNTCHSASARHTDNKVDLVFPARFGATALYNGTPRPGDGYSTCSNVSCHYDSPTPAWGTAGSLNCFGCHTFAKLTASGAHASHISGSVTPTMYNYTANRSTAGEYNFGCSNCHPLTVASHMTGTVNVTLKKDEAGVGSLRAKNSATAAGINVTGSGVSGTTRTSVVCSASYCHSNGDAAALVYAVTPNWYGGVFTGDRCANCHGNAPNSTIAGSKAHYNNRFLGYTSNVGGHQIGIHAMKIYSSPGGFALAGTTGSSSHGNPGTSTTISCNICHYATVTSARNDSNAVCKACHVSGNAVGAQFGNLAVIGDKSRHANGSVDIAFPPATKVRSKAQMRSASFALPLYSSVWKRNVGYKVNGAYDSAKGTFDTSTMWNSTTKTCSNIACHNGQSVKWSDTNGTTDCVSCHTTL